MTQKNSASDDQAAINGMSRAISDEEKAAIKWIKETGAMMHGYFEDFGTAPELILAKTNIEKAVALAVKAITA